MTKEGKRPILVSHPSPDLYGSDLQLLESVAALAGSGRPVHVVLPRTGPLEKLLIDRGASTDVITFPVSRKSVLNPKALPGYVLETVVATARSVRLLRRMRPDLIYANTITAPVWILAGWLTGTPTLCHVHEAEETGTRVLQMLLAAPLLLCRKVVVNSLASRKVIYESWPRLDGRIQLIYNGIAQKNATTSGILISKAAGIRIVLVGRLSPRKGTDVALEALANLVEQGLDVSIALCGDTYPGYEWFEDDLRRRAARDDLNGRVQFCGYITNVRDYLEMADIVIVPSIAEPFGNVAVEAQLAARPVVASNVQGLAEIIDDGRTGLLCPAGDHVKIAEAVLMLVKDPGWSAKIAQAGYDSAVMRFSVERYRESIVSAVEESIVARNGLCRLFDRLQGRRR
ncbi:MAG: glycosyltransferase family 4 protein [Rhodococcus sp. (in: high G+C Gram-positive bacteria)]|uniref:glycosyltransferase family 4 protein n=1 Tax=Rhodococcus sp. TaxID=1831 RepID=UPI002ADB7979|nr:glycosyltransferase family 4 protein [Rhodococcus sp. (in: high G+C Gram-positive bacteria)]MDZ7930497.1 glycosyltransferase family 4 protein [Rhodococcus sp. (in: high G+C Gram-positive bacteria)]